MGRLLLMLFSVFCYAAFFVSFLYLIGFAGAFDFMPTSVNSNPFMNVEPVMALLINIGLISLFGLQHTVMARKGFKERITQIIPEAGERSFFCLTTAIILGIMFNLWTPIEGSLWSIGNETARMLVWGLFWAGWAIVFIATFLLNHFELFGLQQAWFNMIGKEAAPPQMRLPLFYKFVRHPLYSGFMLAFWAAPDMTYSRLLLAAGFSVYIFIGIKYEEKDLVDLFGQDYVDYRRKVGSVVPGIGKSG